MIEILTVIWLIGVNAYSFFHFREYEDLPGLDELALYATWPLWLPGGYIAALSKKETEN